MLSYLLTADDVLQKDNGVHALPVQALADLNGCQNRTVYTALAKLEGKGHIHVEKQATNASPPMVRLTIKVLEQRGLFMVIPLVPPVLDKPKEPKTDRGMPAYAKKLGEYKRSLAVARLRGAELLAYHAVRTVSHSIPASKAAAKGRKAASYGRLIGTAGLMAWIPGTEKTLLGKVLQALRGKRQAPGDDGYRRIAVLNVLTKDIEVSSSVETGSFFRKRCLRATQCFRLSYGIDRFAAAAPILPAVAIPMDSPVPLKITVEPLGEPRITEKARFWQRHSSMEIAALLGQLTEKARWQAEGDEAAKAAARARLHAVLGTPA